MDTFSAALLELFQEHTTRTVAWCVLPNHYHALVEAPNILKPLHELGRFHGRTSHAWNGEETTRGRQVFHRAVERHMRSERHFFATVNHVHNTMFTTTRCIMAMCGSGWNGRGAALRNICNKWAGRRLNESGTIIRSTITERSGMMRTCKAWSPRMESRLQAAGHTQAS